MCDRGRVGDEGGGGGRGVFPTLKVAVSEEQEGKG